MKNIKKYKVNSLAKVDTRLYSEGDFFHTKRSFGFLINGAIRQITVPNMKNYVKKEEVQKMIDKTLQQKEGNNG